MRDLSTIALSTDFGELDLRALTVGELDRLSQLVTETWSMLPVDTDDALTIRFEWLAPMIDAELRHRIAGLRTSP